MASEQYQKVKAGVTQFILSQFIRSPGNYVAAIKFQ